MGEHANWGEQGRNQTFQQHTAQQPQKAAEGPHPLRQGRIGQAEELGQKQQAERCCHQPGCAQRLPLRPQREQLVRIGKVVDRPQHQAGGGDGRQHQEGQPQGRCDVGHDAVEKGHAMGKPQSPAAEQQPQVLHVALDPALIAGQLVHQRRRRLLPAVAQPRFQPDLVAGPAQIGGFDEVMAHDRAAEQSPTGQFAQTTVGHEGLDPQDGVVAPEGSLAQLERGQAGGKQRPVQLAGELLDPREQRAAVEQLGTGLQNPHLPVALHQLDHGYQRFAAHEAVSVQHYHVVVAAPPTAQEVAHVTALVIQVELAPPVEQPARRTQGLDQPCPGRLFAQPDLRLATVGEDEKVEMLELAGAFQAAVDRTEAPQATLDGLVVDGHQDRRARQRRRRQGRRILLAQQGVPVAAQAAQDKAGDGNPETEGDPGKQ